MNVWNFTGNLGGDAETRFTQSGDAIVGFSVGVKSGYGDKATTTWARCSMFGKRGEAVAQYLTKGQLVGVSGEVAMRDWQDKEGQKRTALEVRVNDLTLLGKNDGKQQSQPSPQRSAQGAPPAKKSHDDIGDDIPFNFHAKGRIGHCM